MLEMLAMTITGYLCGSVASAIIVCRLLRLPDPRVDGSGNPGATNVLRLGGRRAAALTLVGDVLKGALPVLLAREVSTEPAVAAGAALGAFLGHLYPVFFRFQGGKGVATTFGAVFALAWPIGAGMATVWVVVAAATRYSSLASIAAALAAPGLILWLTPGSTARLVAFVIIGALLVWRHRGNIARLRARTESRIGDQARKEEPAG